MAPGRSWGLRPLWGSVASALLGAPSASKQMQPAETSLCLGWEGLGRWEGVPSPAQTQSLAAL